MSLEHPQPHKPPSTAPSNHYPNSTAPHSIADYTFSQYKAANLSVDDQHKVIVQLRFELPLIDRDEIDNLLLRSMARQLDLVVFPTCKMMQVDPRAVKRMLDGAFWKAYGVCEEGEEEEEQEKGKLVGGDEGSRKKVKVGKVGSLQKEIDEYVARRKKAKRRVKVVVFRSPVVSEAWEAMSCAQ